MPLGTIGLSTYRWNSAWKSLLLVVLYPIITFWMFWWQVYFIFVLSLGRYGIYHHEQIVARTDAFVYGWGGLTLGAGLVAWLIYSWANHASILRGLCLAHPTTAREEPKLYAILESVCISQGLPTPELEIIESHARNSFVCDIDGDTSRIFITRGLLETLAADEIEAVFAHEVAHILNGDNRLLSFSIAFCNLYPSLSGLANQRHLKHMSPDEMADAFSTTIAMFIIFFPLWAGYVVTSLLRVFLFINRELDADAAAVEMTKNADAVMRALIRINRRSRIPFVNHDIKFLCIDNPSGGFFATHPRLATRLNNLKQITNHPIPEIESSKAAPLHQRFQSSPLLKRVFKPKKADAPKPFNAPWQS